MTLHTIEFDAKDLLKDNKIAVNINHLNSFRWRLRVVCWLLWLAHFISWMDFKVEEVGELEAEMMRLGDSGLVTSVCYGPMKGKGCQWSVDCLDNKTKESFARPFQANSFAHCLEIAKIEAKKRGWIDGD